MLAVGRRNIILNIRWGGVITGLSGEHTMAGYRPVDSVGLFVFEFHGSPLPRDYSAIQKSHNPQMSMAPKTGCMLLKTSRRILRSKKCQKARAGQSTTQVGNNAAVTINPTQPRDAKSFLPACQSSGLQLLCALSVYGRLKNICMVRSGPPVHACDIARQPTGKLVRRMPPQSSQVF